MHQEVPSERTQRDHICRHRAGTTKTHRFNKQLDPTCRLVAMYVDVYIYIRVCSNPWLTLATIGKKTELETSWTSLVISRLVFWATIRKEYCDKKRILCFMVWLHASAG